MKVGVVSPFSWSYIGGVGEHAECQVAALEELGVEARLLTGDDPPGSLAQDSSTPDAPRRDKRPATVIPLGSSVIVPANSSRPHIVLSPLVLPRMRRVFKREKFDIIHVHEPMTPALCVAAMAIAECPVVGTWHATGELNWLKGGMHFWGFLTERIEHRIAVSELARESAQNYIPGDYEIIPNGITIPPAADPSGRDDTVVFIGRFDPRKGLEVLVRAWPEVHRRTGARLRVIGTDPGTVQMVLARNGVSEEGIDMLGVVVGDPLTEELLRAKLLAAPSLGGESFGMVLTRAFGCATPVVASDIPGYARVMSPEFGRFVPPGDAPALTEAIVGLLSDEPARQEMGRAARQRAIERYGWGTIAQRLHEIYEGLLAGDRPAVPLVGTRH